MLFEILGHFLEIIPSRKDKSVSRWLHLRFSYYTHNIPPIKDCVFTIIRIFNRVNNTETHLTTFYKAIKCRDWRNFQTEIDSFYTLN